jgi:UDP-N-acetyl-alpha-D-muramoyl-L-alanyl-L-glutamate epimerase
MSRPHRHGEVFRYVGFDLDPVRRRLTCAYALDGRSFQEQVTFPSGDRWDEPGVIEAARLVFLLAGVSYYKTAAPATIDLGDHAATDTEREFLRSFYLDGLGEFAHRNGLDLGGLRVDGPRLAQRQQAAYLPEEGRPLVPFGGGIDSIVTVELVKSRTPDAALFVVNRPADRFSAIERPASVSGLPVVRAERVLDEQVLRSRELGFLNGHVPVTGILSAIAVMAAVLDGRDAVIMSNEWSASTPTIEVHGRPINHQYSKSMSFEAGLRAVLAESLGGSFEYFSALRPFTELWIARQFAQLTRYFDVFRSCNRAFHIDRSRRLDEWCGQCDKCCFVDLILAPFLGRTALDSIFRGREPLADPSLAEKFRALLGLSSTKPWECVGDVAECRAAAALAAARADRRGAPLLSALLSELASCGPPPAADHLLQPIGTHFIPKRYAADDLLV